MTISYTGDPANNSRDEIRFLVGQTDVGTSDITDEEIAYAVAQEANVRMAAARVALSLAMKYGGAVDKQVGDLKISFSKKHKQYLDLYKVLLADSSSFGATPYAGGISIADKDAVEADTDRVRPAIKRGMHDNPSGQEDIKGICD